MDKPGFIRFEPSELATNDADDDGFCAKRLQLAININDLFKSQCCYCTYTASDAARSWYINTVNCRCSIVVVTAGLSFKMFAIISSIMVSSLPLVWSMMHPYQNNVL